MSANFARIKDPDRTEHYVYRIYGARGKLLYIGCSMDLARRLGEHRRHGTYGHLIQRVETEGPYNYETGRRIEREAIEAHLPAHNREWTPRFRRGAPCWKQPTFP